MVFSKEEIKLLGKQDIKYQRALFCVTNLHDYQGSDGFKDDGLREIKCSCHGSSDSSYTISISINQNNKGINKATCSCPYMDKNSARGELCKHILAALLKFYCSNYEKESATSQKEEVKYKKSKVLLNLQKETVSQTSRKRNLPTWMNKTVNDQSEDKIKDGNKKVKSHIYSGKISKEGQGRRKRPSLVKRTVYCMTPEEFIKTAHEIIKEHDETKMEIQTCAKDEKLKEKSDTTAISCIGEEANREIAAKRKLSQSDCGLESLMFGSIPASDNIHITSHHKEDDKATHIIKETLDSVGEISNEGEASGKGRESPQSDCELEKLMFGSLPETCNQLSTEHQIEATHIIKETACSVEENTDEREACCEGFSQNLFDSQEASDSQNAKESYSILDDLLQL